MKILFSAVGSTGDILPALSLSRHWTEKGHQVSLLLSRDFIPLARQYGLQAYTLDYDYQAMAQPFGRRMGQPLRTGLALLEGLRSIMPLHLSALQQHMSGQDLYFSAGLQLNGLGLAEYHGIPHRHILHAPFWLASAEYSPPYLTWQSSRPGVNRTLWKVTEAVQNRFLGSLLQDERRRLGLPVQTDPLREYRQHMVLALDEALFPTPVEWRHISRVPYPELDSEETLPPEVEEFLEKGRPPVLVGFGSMPDAHPERLPLLLSELAGRLGIRILLQSGWAGYQSVPDQADFLVCGPLPHARLFPHIAAVVHHGGAGTLTAAARAGVPQLIIPHLLDQYFWGKRVMTLGIGYSLNSRRGLNFSSITKKLSDLLGSDTCRQAARQLAAQIRSSLTKADWTQLLSARNSST